MSDYLDTIARAVQSGDEKLVTQTVAEALDAGLAPEEILNKGLIPGIQALGQLFKDGEAYLPEILISTRAMRSGVGKLSPLLAGKAVAKRGTVVVGTIEGDMHDIGKNLVKLMLESNGFEVHDLGVDVPADSFVRAARELNADIVAISALLTTTMVSIPDVVKALEQAGLRNRVKVMIGGAPITRQFADEVGVEGYADDCASAVDEADRLIKSAPIG
ncbi:MAG TPA: cobalamin-binding protein [Dehalococcoidia bacterium]|jgi:5-methyltetrahydrofolate--homocysteine methyltransferase|nr:cobalamin-binding protein [Dehalococcoidia bacterium]